MQQPASSSTSVVMASDVGARAVSDNLIRQDNATEYAAGDVLCAMAGVQFAYACGAAVTTLWGVAVAGDGWTPTAQQVLAFRLHLDRN